MRLLLVNQYYSPDIAPTAQLASDLVAELVAAGHEVTVVTSAARYRTPHLGTREAPLAPLPSRERRDGVDIHRIPSFGWRAGSMPGRVLGYASFLAGAAVETLRVARPDVALVLSTPPMLAGVASLLRRLRGVPFVYWVQDVYPELAAALGTLRPDSPTGRALLHTLGRLARAIYGQAAAIIALDDEMKQRLIAAGAEAGRICVIDHFADCDELRPLPPQQSRLRKALGLPPESTFVVGYAGNLGRGHDFETLIAALPALAALLETADPARPELHFLFVGDGDKRAALQAAVPTALTSRVHFLPPQARSELADVLAACDVGLVTLGRELAGLMVPSKLYGLLAAGLPLLYIGPERGRVAEVVAADGVGLGVRNGDAPGLVAALERLRSDAPLRQSMASAARRLAETRYSRRLITARHAALLTAVAARAGSLPCAP